MLLDVLVHCRNHWNEFWVKNWKFGTTDPKSYAISEIYANSEIHRMSHAPAELLAQLSGLGQLALACWPSSGSVVHSEAFLSSFYNFITLKQHLGNAHNIKRFLK
jgi:hypothetical protein